MKKYPLHYDQKEYSNTQWLCYWIENKNKSMVDFVVHGKSIKRLAINEPNERGLTALDLSVEAENPEWVKALVKHQATISKHVESLIEKDNIKDSDILLSLLLSCLQDRPDLIRPLLERLAQRNALDISRLTDIIVVSTQYRRVGFVLSCLTVGDESNHKQKSTLIEHLLEHLRIVIKNIQQQLETQREDKLISEIETLESAVFCLTESSNNQFLSYKK